MKWALLFFLGTTGAVIVALCIIGLLVRSRVRRRHRVDPAVRTQAPMTWLVDPRQPAQLHRRLTKVGRTAGAVADDHRPPAKRLRRTPAPPPIVGVAEDLRAHAVVLDAELARLVRLSPQARRQPIQDVACDVAELEVAAARLLALSAQLQAPRALDADDPMLSQVTAQVQRLAEAHAALDALDVDAGLRPQVPVEAPAALQQQRQ